MSKQRTKAEKIKAISTRQTTPAKAIAVDDQIIGYPVKLIHQDLLKSLVLTLLLVILLLAIFLYTKSR